MDKLDFEKLNKVFEKYGISTLDTNTPDEALKELNQMI